MLKLLRLFILLLSCTPQLSVALDATNTTHEYTLNNGLRLFVKEDHRAPVVVSQVWYRVGSSYEANGLTGISHALEHMMFKGTHKYPADRFSRIIGENGGRLNASTGRDYTFYYEELASDKLPLAFALEADRMHNLELKQQDFAKEIEVVKEERRLRTDNNPLGKTYERYSAAAHISSPYHHPVIGWMSDLNEMTVQELKQWYSQWYAPNNAIVVVAGDVKASAVLTLAKKYFDLIPANKLPPAKQFTEQEPLGLRTLSVHIPAQVPWLIMGYQVPSVTTSAVAWEPYALTLLASILDLGASARLSKHLIRGKHIATNASANYEPFVRLNTLFEFSATPAPGKSIEQVKLAILSEIDQLKTTLVSKQELERARTQLTADKVYSQDSITTQAELIGYAESIGTSWRAYDNFLQMIQSITPEQIQAVAKKYLITDRLTLAVLEPETLKLQEQQS